MINKKVVAMKIVNFLDIYAHAAYSCILSDGTARLSDSSARLNSFWYRFFYVKMMRLMIIKYAILGSVHLLCR